MKIDVFSHIVPEKYRKFLSKVFPSHPFARDDMPPGLGALFDLETRFSLMDKFEGLVQVLTLAVPSIWQITELQKSVDLAKAGNDAMAELVSRYPDRFAASVAVLPLNHMSAVPQELDRAINDLKLKGVLLFSSINGKPLDSPEFLPIYEKMSRYDLPIWIHPEKDMNLADYETETRSLYGIYSLFGWPHETAVAMARLAFSGVLEKYPKLKIITHHCGGTMPYLAGRVAELCSGFIKLDAPKYAPLTKKPIEYLKMFYGDTATYAGAPALMCGYDFFGAEHMLFGTDMPHAWTEPGVSGIRLAISGIDQMEIGNQEKKKIYEDNARRLLHLT